MASKKKSQKLHGTYVGLLNGVKGKARTRVRKVFKSKGVRAAIAFLRKRKWREGVAQ